MSTFELLQANAGRLQLIDAKLDQFRYKAYTKLCFVSLKNRLTYAKLKRRKQDQDNFKVAQYLMKVRTPRLLRNCLYAVNRVTK